jgi:ribosomal protein L34
MPLRRMRSALLLWRTSIVSPSRTETTGPVKSAQTRNGNRRLAQRKPKARHELAELRDRFKAGNMAVTEEGETVCCYARSDKSWIQDPAGIPWETYRTMEDAQLFSGQSDQAETACCTPDTMGEPECCEPSDKTVGCCS